MSNYKRLWLNIALFFFFLTSLAGLFLRLLPFLSNFNNKYHYGVLQSHSHTGFLGWVFIALYAFLVDTFGTKDLINKKKTVRILIILTVLLLGMYISFPFNGYGIFSITFLSLFLIYSYYTLVYFYKNIDSKYSNCKIKKFLIAGIIFYFISSIGPWALAPIMAMGYKKTHLYYDTIFMYLHFLYNGFITFTVIALYLNQFRDKIIESTIKKKYLHISFVTLLLGSILSYAESLLWHNPPFYVFILAVTGSLLILISVFYLYKSTQNFILKYNSIERFLITSAITFFIIKIVLQSFQAFPYFAKISYELDYNPYNQALNAFNRYVTEYPESPHREEAMSYLTKMYLSTNNYSQALESIEKIQDKSPELLLAYQRILYSMAISEYNNGKYDIAIGYFDRSIELKKDRSFTAKSYYWKAECYFKKKDFDSSISDYKTFLTTNGAFSDANYNMAHYNIAYANFYKKNYKESNKEFRIYVLNEVNKNSVFMNDAYNRIGDSYFIQKKYSKAVENYDNALNIALRNVDYTLYKKAEALGPLKQFDQKAASFERLIKEYPNSTYAGNAEYALAQLYNIVLQDREKEH